jgi:hypothetical protein
MNEHYLTTASVRCEGPGQVGFYANVFGGEAFTEVKFRNVLLYAIE